MICFDVRVLDNARRLLAALILAGCGVVLGQLPAHACSCVSGGTQSHTKQASDVFTGTVSDVSRQRSGRPVTTYTVAVERVYKGEVRTATVEVSSTGSSHSCALTDLKVDRSYLFFARADGSALSANSCGGTAPASAAQVTRVERLLGDGRPATPPQVPKAEFTRVANAQPESLSRLAAPGVALVLAGLLGLFVVRRLNARA